MKIDIISHSDSVGGAAKAAYRLHLALNNTSGTLSNMLVTNKLSDDFNVISDGKIKSRIISYVRFLLSKNIQKLQKTDNEIYHSLNFFGSGIFRKIQNSNSEIINLHWINGETLSIKQIGKINKPVVMTLHDMWAFCGTEHLSIDSLNSQFRLGYDSVLDSDFISGVNLNRFVWNKKMKYWSDSNFTIVTPSHWLSKCAKDSMLFSNCNVYTIPNALNTDVFKPCNKKTAREILSLPIDKKIIGFGAMGGGRDKNKGFDLLKEALNLLDSKDEYLCLVFGQSQPEEDFGINLPIKFIGHISDDVALALFYNAIDVMVVPSRQEAFGQTASESQACGTPVVAFNTTGLIDIVDHKVTGYLANAFDVNDLAAGIKWCVKNNYICNVGEKARIRAINLWSYSIIAEKYNNIFNTIDRSVAVNDK